MNNRLLSSIQRLHPLLWQTLCFIVSIIIYIGILENRSPNFLRTLSISLRTSFGLVILAVTLIVYLAYRVPGPMGFFTGMATTLALFAMPLAGTWASGQTQSILLNGLIPISDATSYYIDSLRILNGIDISSFSGMRPLFPGFLSFLLSITNRDLMAALAILTVLMGIASFIASREIQRTHGTEPAALFLMCMFLYLRHHSGTTLSESLAVTVSLLGLALIWQGKEKNREWIALLGIVITTFALNIRPGAMFVLPAFLLWGAWYFRGEKKISIRFLLLGAILIVSVFFLNGLVVRILAGPNGVAFANFSWALYGLSSGGKSFEYIFQTHPEVFSLGQPEQNLAIYKLAIDLMFQNPGLLIKGAIHYWGIFFSSTWYNAYSFVAGNSFLVNEIARWSLYLLCGLGLLKWIKDRDDSYASLAGLGALGVLFSVPFVPPTDGYRVRLYDATIPIFGLLPAIGVAHLRDRLNFPLFPRTLSEAQQTSLTIPFSVLFMVILVIAPILIKTNSQLPVIKTESCPSGMDLITIRFDPDTYINVTKQNMVYLDWMPNFHVNEFQRNYHGLADTRLMQTLGTISPPSTLFYTLDLRSKEHVLVIMKTDELPKTGELSSICGYRVEEWETGLNATIYRIFLASHIAGK